MPIRRTWSELRDSAEFRGRWVALDEVKLDGRQRPMEGTVVDVDDSLVALCTRMRRADLHHCTVLFCDDEPPPSTRARSRFVPPVVSSDADADAAPARLH